MTWPRWVTDPLDSANLREVAPNLYVGSRGALAAGPWDVVYDLIGESSVRPENYTRVRRLLVAPFSDGTPIPKHYLDNIVPDACDALARGERVLVHCAMGLSRSASIAYAILRECHGMGHRKALERVRTPGVLTYPHPVVLHSARTWVKKRSR